jgi:CubicO group peptidase (beta-lactamase class C family)
VGETRIRVDGEHDPRFAAVRDAFERNFEDLREIGAAVAVYVGGQKVVDLWGGVRERSAQPAPWTQDTLVNVYSSTKGLAALCVQQLIDRGLLDPDARVADYWPEFAHAGKADVRLRTLLCHAAGLAALTRRLPQQAVYNQALMASALADQAPHWPPGTRHGYHAQTFGFLLAELVRRAAGHTLGQHLREQIAGPLQAEAYIGLPEALDPRVAKVTRPLGEEPPRDEVDLLAVWKREPGSLTAQAFNNPTPQPGAVQTRAYRAAELPSSNGHASALGLARIYAAASGSAPREVPGATGVFSPACAARCAEEHVWGEDLVLRVRTRFGPGFMLSQPSGSGHFGPNPRSFGHPGMGGSLGFADPDAGVGFGYVMNRAGAGILIDPRPRRLIDALYASI